MRAFAEEARPLAVLLEHGGVGVRHDVVRVMSTGPTRNHAVGLVDHRVRDDGGDARVGTAGGPRARPGRAAGAAHDAHRGRPGAVSRDATRSGCASAGTRPRADHRGARGQRDHHVPLRHESLIDRVVRHPVRGQPRAAGLVVRHVVDEDEEAGRLVVLGAVGAHHVVDALAARHRPTADVADVPALPVAQAVEAGGGGAVVQVDHATAGCRVLGRAGAAGRARGRRGGVVGRQVEGR
jgi:hypothetical protein